MKYWRGFLVAGICGACSWGLLEFAKGHPHLIDMVLPYISRMLSGSAAQWSSGVSFCLWQVLVVAVVLGVLALIGLAIVLRWNLVQTTGWIAAVISFVMLLNTGFFGMNQYAGPIAEDIHLELTDYDLKELEEAGSYFLSHALLSKDALPKEDYPSFEELAKDAADGFQHLVYKESCSVFAGSMVPVKKLGWSSYYADKGITGVTVNLTGESAVNPKVPNALLPFAISHEMAHRMSISNNPDANFSAFLAGKSNDNPYFVYTAYLNAYRYCFNSLRSMSGDAALAAAARLKEQAGTTLDADLAAIDKFMKKGEDAVEFRATVKNLVSWYIQEIYLPLHANDEDVPKFDPMDETQVELPGLLPSDE